MNIGVENRNGRLVVVLPKNIKVTNWLDSQYGIKEDITSHEYELPTRTCNVTIIKPEQVQTPMGIVMQNRQYVEVWYYFDIPMKSILVTDGDDITKELGLEEVAIELKELEGEVKNDN